MARRFGANIFGKAPQSPAAQAKSAGHARRETQEKIRLGMQLDERQKLKAVYGLLSQKQLVNAYRKALTRKGNTAHNFILLG